MQKNKFLVTMFISVVAVTAEILTPAFVIRKLLEFLESPDQPKENEFFLVGCLVFCLFVRLICKSVAIFLSIRMGACGKAAILGMIYEKSIKLKSVGSKSVGELVNMSANDTTRIMESSIFLSNLIILPGIVIIETGYLLYYIGPSALVGTGLVLIYLPFQLLLGQIFAKLRQKTVIFTDKRVKMISEVLVSIKLIKMYAWENAFSKAIYALRQNERFALQRMAFVQGFTFSFGYIITILAPVLTFITQIYTGYELDVPKAFTLIAMFNQMSFYIVTGPLAMRGIAEALVSFRRLKDLLDMEEHVGISNECSDTDNLIEVKDGNFAWKKVTYDEIEDKSGEDEVVSMKDENAINDAEVEFKPDEKKALIRSPNETEKEDLVPTLFNINFNVKKQSLIGICGSVGSGKSSLIQALLGEMIITDGNIAVNDSIAYVPQQAWIVNSTVRENILFGKEYEENFYKDVCTACALDTDLKLMASGDLTEIGERGVNLSGGQKQRISLARAVYAEKELYFLDDPLSAVDSHVGKHIFEKCIKLALRRHTVVFVTHQLQYLKECDYVYYMSNGQFTENGTYEELLNNNKEFASDIKKFHEDHNKENKNHDKEFISTYQMVIKDAKSSLSMHKSFSQLSDAQSCVDFLPLETGEGTNEEKQLAEEGRLIKVEEKAKGSVSLGTYASFCKYAGGFFPMFMVIFLIFATIGVSMLGEFWLSHWLQLKDSAKLLNVTTGNQTVLILDEVDTDYYMKIYMAIAGGVLVFTCVSTFTTVFVLLRASTSLHNEVFKKILTSPMEFFDTTPIGRIVNRLARDVDDIDNYLPWMSENCLRNLTRVFGSLIFIGYILPWFLLGAFPAIVFFFVINIAFRKVIRAIKRLDNVSRSPMYSHLTTTVQGLLVVRAFRKQQMFIDKFETYLDKNSLALYLFHASARWFGTYVDLLCVLISFATCLSAVMLKGDIPASLSALCIIYSIRILGLFQFSFRLVAEVESKFTSVERLNHYAKTLEPEGAFKTADRNLIKDWPKDGSIEFKNASLRYRDGLPLVLKDFSLHVKHQEKIGIVGRTGAGKSSIGVALYRIVNLESGSIKIGGCDTQLLGLSDLRSKLSIIPQDPILFIGTIRYNLDPFNESSDEELWNVLEKAHIKEMLSEMPQKLESMVLENGSNFSVGERQLICMARALLRKSTILILDEATAAIDSKTDSKIQETIKRSFADCTVLTVAHRLNTIMHCDRILVMEAGKVAEFDTPSNLMSNEDSMFSKMVMSSDTRVLQ